MFELTQADFDDCRFAPSPENMDIVGKWLQVMAEECEIILGADMRHGVTNWKPRFHDLMEVIGPIEQGGAGQCDNVC